MNASRIANDLGTPKHGIAIEVLNRLLIDLKLQLLGRTPYEPITQERLADATVIVGQLSQCREPTRYR
ncbi:MAG: hypothetical protein ABSH20_31390 [Tepidisphaeraceae bacterium]